MSKEAVGVVLTGFKVEIDCVAVLPAQAGAGAVGGPGA